MDRRDLLKLGALGAIGSTPSVIEASTTDDSQSILKLVTYELTERNIVLQWEDMVSTKRVCLRGKKKFGRETTAALTEDRSVDIMFRCLSTNLKYYTQHPLTIDGIQLEITSYSSVPKRAE